MPMKMKSSVAPPGHCGNCRRARPMHICEDCGRNKFLCTVQLKAGYGEGMRRARVHVRDLFLLSFTLPTVRRNRQAAARRAPCKKRKLTGRRGRIPDDSSEPYEAGPKPDPRPEPRRPGRTLGTSRASSRWQRPAAMQENALNSRESPLFTKFASVLCVRCSKSEDSRTAQK